MLESACEAVSGKQQPAYASIWHSVDSSVGLFVDCLILNLHLNLLMRFALYATPKTKYRCRYLGYFILWALSHSRTV